tara:strand:- start:2264 stop:2845 length:582 start_codon:yes stop_codon:yes gene_type:complete
MNSVGKAVIRYFVQGLVLIVPIVTTIYILYYIITLIDGIVPWNLFPGAGLLIIFVLLTLLGMLGDTLILTPIQRAFMRLLDRAPLIKTIYTSITDLLSAFVGKKRKFNQPVLVSMSTDSEVHKLGFITEENLSDLGISDEKVAVYLPHSYNFSGNLFIVSKTRITPLDAKAADVMKFIVSGGVTSVSDSADEQ